MLPFRMGVALSCLTIAVPLVAVVAASRSQAWFLSGLTAARP